MRSNDETQVSALLKIAEALERIAEELAKK